MKAGPGRAGDMTDTLVLVPGLNCTARLFEPQIAALGAGREILIADHARDDTMAAIARRLLDRAPESFALAGLSMGGYIALEVMRQAPERVARLALLDTNARADTDEQRRSREREIALAEAKRFAQACEARWARSVHPDRRSDPELRQVYDLMAAETGPEVFVRQLRAIMGRRDSRPALPAIRVPTLIVVGDADELTPPEQAREMAVLVPAATLVVVPRCGHLSIARTAASRERGARDLAWLLGVPRRGAGVELDLVDRAGDRRLAGFRRRGRKARQAALIEAVGQVVRRQEGQDADRDHGLDGRDQERPVVATEETEHGVAPA